MFILLAPPLNHRPPHNWATPIASMQECCLWWFYLIWVWRWSEGGVVIVNIRHYHGAIVLLQEQSGGETARPAARSAHPQLHPAGRSCPAQGGTRQLYRSQLHLLQHGRRDLPRQAGQKQAQIGLRLVLPKAARLLRTLRK